MIKHTSAQNVLTGTGDYCTLQDIANKLGVSRERVRQLEKRALKKLRSPELRERWESILATIEELERQPSYGYRRSKGNGYSVES